MVQNKKNGSDMVNGILTIILAASCGLIAFSEKDSAYPVPDKTTERLFYIHRNHNANTIVYDANFDARGILEANSPVDVYWLRYQEQGQRMELRKIEKLFAYGVDCSPVKDKANEFILKLVADPKREFRLVQKEPFNALVVTSINKQESQIDHLYIYADNTSLWPKVKYIELFGYDIKNGEPTYERVWNE
jgi:hypothetical protein